MNIKSLWKGNKMDDKINYTLADSFMAIFGFKRVGRQDGNVITPVEFERCATCGDSDCIGGAACQTGDGE